MAAARSIVLAPGDRLGDFRVVQVIGFGGMAIVYRAEQLAFGRQVALKVLAPRLADDDAFRERFRREARLAAAIEHPHIVPVYLQGEDAGQLYIAMRLIEGGTLLERLRGPGVGADETLRLLRPVAAALDAAHAQSLIHRDVKPQNVLIGPGDHPYLTDFGIATTVHGHGLTATGQFQGSVHYAAPEQIRGEPLSAASDVYALTAVLWQCLTGQVPYPFAHDVQVMNAHLHAPPPRIAAHWPDAPAALDAVLAAGLAKEPADRPASAPELLERAAAALAQTPLPAGIPAFPLDGEADAGDPSRPADGAVAEAGGRGGEAGADRDLAGAAGASRGGAGAGGGGGGAEAGGGATTGGRRRVPRAVAWAGCAAAIAAPLAAFALTGGDAPERPAPATAGALVVRHDGAWSRPAAGDPTAGGELPGATGGGDRQTGGERVVDREPTAGGALPRFADAVVLRRARPGPIVARAGALARPAPVPGGLPRGLAAAATGPARGAAVRLGSLAAVRYDLATPAAALRLFVIPTDRGDQALACRTAPAPPSALLAACDRLAGALRLRRGAHATAAGADPRLARGLAAALRDLADARGSRRGALAAADPRARARAAAALAAAHRAAAARLAGLRPRPGDRAVVASLRRVLRALAGDVDRLRRAAVQGDRAAHAAARRALEGDERALAAALARLGRHGYRPRR